MSELIHFPICPHSRFIRLLIEELKIKTSYKIENFWQENPGFLAYSPLGILPVWLLNGAMITGAGPIAEFLMDGGLENHDEELPLKLMPETPLAKAEVRRINDWMLYQFTPQVWSYFEKEKLLSLLNQQEEPDIDNLRIGLGNLKKHLKLLELLIGSRYWAAGDHLTMADFSIAASISCIDFFGSIPWGDFPALKDWYARIKSRPSFRSLLTDHIISYEPPAYYADPDF